MLTSNLLEDPEIEFVTPRKFNGDSTENLFGWMRGNCGEFLVIKTSNN